MRRAALLLLFVAACSSGGAHRLYKGAERPGAELALVEVNTYSQKRTLRWVIVGVRLPDGQRVKGSFDIPGGAYELQVDWRLYDATEKADAGDFLVPFADLPKLLDEGVKTFSFKPEAGRFYRLQWTARDDVALEPSAEDMELTLVDAGQRPTLADSGTQ